jgi:hypothetical protein
MVVVESVLYKVRARPQRTGQYSRILELIPNRLTTTQPVSNGSRNDLTRARRIIDHRRGTNLAISTPTYDAYKMQQSDKMEMDPVSDERKEFVEHEEQNPPSLNNPGRIHDPEAKKKALLAARAVDPGVSVVSRRGIMFMLTVLCVCLTGGGGSGIGSHQSRCTSG